MAINVGGRAADQQTAEAIIGEWITGTKWTDGTGWQAEK